MRFNDTHIDFPATSQVNFAKLFDALEVQANDADPQVAAYAQGLLQEMEDLSELRKGISKESRVAELKPQIDKLLRVLFPDALLSNEIKAVVPPYSFEPIYASTRFESIMNNAGEDYEFSIKDFDVDMFYIMGCATILGKYYGFPMDLSRPMTIEIPNVKSGTSRFYRLAYNADMMTVKPTKKALDITEDDFHQLVDNLDNIALWKEKFPVDSWNMSGFGIINLMDVSVDQSLAMITSNLLVKSADTGEKIADNIRTLFNINDLQVGFTAMESGVLFQTHKSKDNYSILLGGKERVNCTELMCDGSYETLIRNHQTFVVPDVDTFHSKSGSLFAQNLKDQNIESYICEPLYYNDEYLGFLEIGSPRKRELNALNMLKLKEVTPILSMAVRRFKEESKNRIEAIIQQECTSIHSSVKWRFEEEASKYMMAEHAGERPQFADIILKDVYPLYGQLDIKGSSTLRNEAVKVDLLTQMDLVTRVLRKAGESNVLPALDELIHRVDRFVHEIDDGLLAGSEHRILGFLRKEIYPVIEHLQNSDSNLAKLIEQYSTRIDSELKMVYEARRDFDNSVKMTNQRLAAFIDEKQDKAQQMFPHYFERYKTDGLEYNMYMGNAIVRDMKYHPFFLANLRIWQLITMVEMEREFRNLRSEMPVPLEVASLILVYNTPLSIHFRMDEKRFDVEGAYNARYEIVKKRVDKAHIKGTNERITIPGKIAIIYTGEQEIIEYRKYIQFLEAKGFLVPGSTEDHELEDLQGITGLRALRVEVDYAPDASETLTYEQVLEALGTP